MKKAALRAALKASEDAREEQRQQFTTLLDNYDRAINAIRQDIEDLRDLTMARLLDLERGQTTIGDALGHLVTRRNARRAPAKKATKQK